MNRGPLIESACATRKLLDDNGFLLTYATTKRLEELLNAIAVELRERDIKVQNLSEVFDEYEDELYRMSLESMAARRMLA